MVVIQQRGRSPSPIAARATAQLTTRSPSTSGRHNIWDRRDKKVSSSRLGEAHEIHASELLLRPHTTPLHLIS
ncbi:UNVERIFIED_CONTAM: hypothetical protein Sangu_2406300 [Sesamum angustifolium]|uniref:Uncharacterized protein n=1 Tax=Sesamum angustifolium TaxID=2727405 RepID=A0AAW2KVQ0_9LAMI